MANIDLFVPKLLKHEGGYVDDPLDRGGATNLGITIATWRTYGFDKDMDGDIDKEDVKLITKDDFKRILKTVYWDKCNADKINNQSVAEIFVDWAYLSGSMAKFKVQELLHVKQDGSIGNQTIEALNKAIQRDLWASIRYARLDHIRRIILSRPNQIRFKRGWLNRINSFKFEE